MARIKRRPLSAYRAALSDLEQARGLDAIDDDSGACSRAARRFARRACDRLLSGDEESQGRCAQEADAHV